MSFKPDPKLDLVLERLIDVPVELVWKAWTTPELLKQWFCPKPWYVSHCEIDLRPGGRCYTVMNGPNGESFPNTGCYLEIVPNQKLVFTDALLADYRPAGQGFMTAIVTMKKEGKGTRYTAIALHNDEAGRKKHEEMGFYEGWGKALDQLVELVKKLR
ncbi:MAG: SRPBCC family protein [Planctomycetes bacterium]|jgi:uncharacterized protein YndB with AHSA1/START domain|nr:SRPBCC family protein [Planctomycetota bacterium]MCL4731894.1 SRPBCC family protein [Planctomycetota bacterium]